jgi:tetratricopeptide (TPR) repeat protein
MLTQAGLRAASPEERESSFAEAEKSYRTAFALSPLDPDYPANLSRLFAAWAQTTTDVETQRVRLERALRFCEDALARHPENVRLWNDRGAILFLMGERAGALEAYRTSLALDDRFADTHLHVGDLWRTEGELEAAAEAYEKVFALSPPSASGAALRRLAAVYPSLGRVEDAIDVNQRILRREPRDAAAHGNLASLFSVAGDWEKALAHADRAIETAAPRDKETFEDLKTRLEGRSIAAQEQGPAQE